MKTIDEIRLENLELAIARMGGVAAKLAAAAELAPAYISQLRTKAPYATTGKQRTLGTSAARKIEAAIGEYPGWMDRDHAPSPAEEPASPAAWPFSVSPKDLGQLTAAEMAALNTVVSQFVAGCLSSRQQIKSLELGPAGSDVEQQNRKSVTRRKV
ncbi:hypothetical protein [Cupriavidus gilardii]|uniref:hypothetical protein n=1 Tax=Cupriavidus gilardii TaxID=82541 RepID=UPI0021B3150F|nr:hypothetical protein [Cupriavidus gilardii]UXC34809.1 hypothetical protein N4G38_10180 [Cupriavidus gilardii]